MRAEEIEPLRKQLGLTQVQLAQLLGVHPLTVSRWERQELSPSAHHRALLDSFRKAKTSSDDIGEQVKSLLVTAGVVMALYALLKAAMGDD